MTTLELFHEIAAVMQAVMNVEGKDLATLKRDNEKIDRLIAKIDRRLKELGEE